MDKKNVEKKDLEKVNGGEFNPPDPHSPDYRTTAERYSDKETYLIRER